MLVSSLSEEVYQLEDKRSIILRDLSIAVVVGYQHPPGEYVAYVKYVYTGKGLWNGYERVVKKYSPEDVMSGRIAFDPNFGSEVPVVSVSEILEAPDPIKRMEEVVSSPKDRHEFKALEVKEETSLDLGIIGSLLLRIHHEGSDVDLAVYNNYFEAWELLKELGVEDEQWILNVSERLGLPVEIVKEYYYSKAIRSIWEDMPISFSYVKRGYSERYGTFPKPLGEIFEGEVKLDDVDERTFIYPHLRKGNINILSFEGAYLRPLIECDTVWVRAPLFENETGTFVVLGTKEYRGIVKPKSPCR